jgi:cell division protein FtsZ
MGDEAAGFVAPKPPGPGRPSPEAISRLQAAVNKVPKTPGSQPAVAPSGKQAENSGRFGINNLINKMTGHSQEPPARRDTPQVHPRAGLGETQEVDPDQERVDIPAFLRRQAN